MTLVEITLLALGLAMDATAVSIATGVAAASRPIPTRSARRAPVRVVDAGLVAVFFGGFQAGMPALGYLAGDKLRGVAAAYGHWVAFGLLAAIGAKMIYEAFSHGEEERAKRDPFGLKVLVLLAIATSVDALAAGVTLSFVGADLAPAVAIIGGITAALSFAGVYVGRRFGDRFGSKLDVAGGVVLLALGVKVLVDHYAT